MPVAASRIAKKPKPLKRAVVKRRRENDVARISSIMAGSKPEHSCRETTICFPFRASKYARLRRSGSPDTGGEMDDANRVSTLAAWLGNQGRIDGHRPRCQQFRPRAGLRGALLTESVCQWHLRLAIPPARSSR